MWDIQNTVSSKGRCDKREHKKRGDGRVDKRRHKRERPAIIQIRNRQPNIWFQVIFYGMMIGCSCIDLNDIL